MYCRPARQKAQFKIDLHSDTGYPVQTPILYLKLTFLNKKGTSFFFYIFINIYQLIAESEPVTLFCRISCYLTLIIH